MTHFLNLTLPIKQDDQSQAAVVVFAEKFGAEAQPQVNHMLKASRQVHHARAIVIKSHDQKKILYLQVITEYDTSFEDYTVFFSRYLPTFFEALFTHVIGGLTLEQIKDRNQLVKFISKHDLPSLGSESMRFSAYPQTVKDIQDKFGITAPALPPLS